MPAAIAQRGSAQRKPAAVIRSQDAHSAFGRVAVPTYMHGMVSEFFAIRPPRYHCVGARKLHILRHFYPKCDRVRRVAGNSGKVAPRIQMAVESQRGLPAAFGPDPEQDGI